MDSKEETENMERERGGMTSSKCPQVELNWGLCISYAEHLLTASWEIPIILLIVLLHGLGHVSKVLSCGF